MSGHKRATISISEDEYRRLHDAEMKLRFLPKKSAEPSILNNQVHAAVQDHYDQIRSRQEAFERTMSVFQGEIRSVEYQTGSALLDQQAHFTEQISEAVGSLWERTQVLLDEQSARFDTLIMTEHQARQAEVFSLQEAIVRVEETQNHKYELAEQWIQAAEELCAFICDQYDVNRFSDGEIIQYQYQLQQSTNNLQDGAPEAALMQAQQSYRGLSDLRLVLEKRENEWTTLYQASWEGIYQLLENARSCYSCAAHDLDGNELEVPVDVDFWSCGDLSRAVEHIEDLCLSLQDENIRSGDLTELLEKSIPNARQAVEDSVFHARLAILNSQLRINIADLVIEALQKQGYVLQQAEYASSDQRMAYSAKVRNLEGNEIVIQVNPSDQVGKNELHMVSLDREDRTEHELRQRSLEVTRSLGQHGLQVDNLRSIGSHRKRSEPNHQKLTRTQQVQPAPGSGDNYVH